MNTENLVIGDIGGTNTFLGVMNKTNYKLILVKEYETSKINLEEELKKLTNKKTKKIILGIAEQVNKKKKKHELTNNKLIIDITKIKKATKHEPLIINDFEAISYYLINKTNKKAAIIGAGTGLGKAIIQNNEIITSEGCFADFPFKEKEIKLQIFFTKKLKKHPSYENLVSGKGIQLINNYYENKKNKQVKTKKTPKEIFEEKNPDTIKTFTKFYGRAIKNFCLETNTENVYLAGGIIRKNPWIINTKEFKEEITHNLLKHIKIKIIKDKYAGLLGAGLTQKEDKK